MTGKNYCMRFTVPTEVVESYPREMLEEELRLLSYDYAKKQNIRLLGGTWKKIKQSGWQWQCRDDAAIACASDSPDFYTYDIYWSAVHEGIVENGGENP